MDHILKFKTNINCGGCINTVTPLLNNIPRIKNWNVDTTNPAKILTVDGEDVTEETVINTLQKAGYKAEVVTQA